MARRLKDIFLDFETFKLGLYALEDTTKAPIGTARIMKNMVVTDRGGIGPRPGTELLGTKNTNGNGIRGFYNFRKSFDTDEFLIKAYDDELEAYSKNHSSAGWWRLKNGFTANKEFGFVTSLVNEDNEDYVVFCNRFEAYQRWVASVTLLDGALTGAESSVVVDSVLTDEVFDSKTASGSSTTTLNVTSTPWVASQWVNMYVHITNGSKVGFISKISGNTDGQITFAAISGLSGTPTFEIRKAAFPASGTIIYNGTTIAYTAIPEITKLTVSSAHAGSDNDAVTLVPTEYPGLPRGNRLTNFLNRIIVGNVRSALARDSGGALQGFSAGGSYFVSKLNNPFNFDFAASRVAGEGDIISTPYGGGEITDVQHQEDTAYIFKKKYIESIKYSQDANDLAIREPLKEEIGSVGQVIKGSDDIYFITEDNRFTSIGRVRAKDIKPQTENLGFNIKRLLDVFVFGTGKGIEYKDKIYIPLKEDSNETNNNLILIYSKINKSFEGVWNIGAFSLEKFDGKLYYSESNGANVFEMLIGKADVEGTTRFPITATYATHFMNLAGSKSDLQALNSVYFEGYIKGNTTITFEGFKDFSTNTFLSFDFTGTEDSLLDGMILNAFLGAESLGLQPLGSISDADADGRRHFQFKVYFPFQYGNFFSIGWQSSGEDDDYEITRFGLSLKESISVDTNRIKSI